MTESERDKTPAPYMPGLLSRRALLQGSAVGAAALLLDATVGTRLRALEAANIGPSTTVAPYVVPTAAGVDLTALLTVGDLPAGNGYRMAGIPDGLGAFENRGGTFTVLMNHELGSTAGITRAHGSVGAFVSEWTINKKDLKVLEGRDFTPSASHVHNWGAAGYAAGTTAWNRFCSADLAKPAAFSYRRQGTDERLFLNGEETDNGRAYAHVATGPNKGHSWQLPRLGRMAWENVVASPHGQEKTIVICLDDGDLSTDGNVSDGTNNPCEIFVYVGTKTDTGNEIQRAGLTNGKLYGMKVTVGGAPVLEEHVTTALGGASDSSPGSAGLFTLVEMGASGDVSGWETNFAPATSAGHRLSQDSIAKGLLRMRRIEDGAWDPRRGRQDDFYFVTTADLNTPSRLWRLRFNNVEDPLAGGTLTNLLPNSSPQKMLDNLCIDGLGRILLQEDVGGNTLLGKIWLYGIDSGELIEVAHHNPTFFTPASPHFMTNDEESSGIIDVESILGRGWFLLDVQNHKAIPAPPDTFGLVQHGQLLAMYVPPRLGRTGRDDDDDDDRDDDD